MAVFKHGVELTDVFLRQMAALGADCIDFGDDTDTPAKTAGWAYSIGYLKALYAALAA